MLAISDRMRLKCQLSSRNGGESTAYNGGLTSFFLKKGNKKKVFLWIKKQIPAGDTEDLDGPAYLLLLSQNTLNNLHKHVQKHTKD